MQLSQIVCGYEVAGRIQEHGSEWPEKWKQVIYWPRADQIAACRKGESKDRQKRSWEKIKQMYVHVSAA